MILNNKTIAEKLINTFKEAADQLLIKYNTDTIKYQAFIDTFSYIYGEKIPSAKINKKTVSIWADPACYYDELDRLSKEYTDLVAGSYTKSVSLYIKNDKSTGVLTSENLMHIKFKHIKTMSADGFNEAHKVFIEFEDTGAGIVIDESYGELAKEVATIINRCCEHWTNLFEELIAARI